MRRTSRHERAINQRLRTLPIKAPRGTILDRNGNVLVDSRSVYDVVLQREKGKQIDQAALLDKLPDALDLDPEYLKERFSEINIHPAYQSLLIKENASIHDIAWVEARSLEFPLLHIEQRPQRRYPPAGLLAHVLAGEITVVPEYREAVVEAMWSVVNEAGTATGILKAGYDIAGKTGTAQVVGLGKMWEETRTMRGLCRMPLPLIQKSLCSLSSKTPVLVHDMQRPLRGQSTTCTLRKGFPSETEDKG